VVLVEFVGDEGIIVVNLFVSAEFRGQLEFHVVTNQVFVVGDDGQEVQL